MSRALTIYIKGPYISEANSENVVPSTNEWTTVAAKRKKKGKDISLALGEAEHVESAPFCL